jgi:hypothetical protein
MVTAKRFRAIAVWAFHVEGRIAEVLFVVDPKSIARLEVLLLD